MKTWNIRLEDAYEVLLETEGATVPAAKKLGVPLHSLMSLVAKHAELQSIIKNRDHMMVDYARRDIVAIFEDATILPESRTALAKWVLVNAASQDFSPKTTVETKPKSYSDMSEEELLEFIKSKTTSLGIANVEQPTS